MKSPQQRYCRPRPRRSASVLVLALIVVALLTLGAMSFFERMFAEHRAARAFGRQLQARRFAESGVDYVKAVLTQDPAAVYQSGGTYDSPSLFQGVLVLDDEIAAFRGRFTVLAPQLQYDGNYGGVRYGLENESSRLNLNTVLLADNYEEDGARQLLMALRGMTEPVADAILDWLDEDDEPRLLGAEQDYYTSLDSPYKPRNGPLQTIEELLLVRGVTPALMFGADANRNALVDASEQPLTNIPNVDNADGALNRGWAAYLTLDSAEKNIRSDGQPKIDVNMNDLEELHRQLAEVLDDDMANFIVAYRQGGAYDGDEAGKSASSIELDYTQRGAVQLMTVLDLVGAKTRVVQQGQTERTVVDTPFSDDRSSMQSYLPKLMDNLAVNASPSIPGRLNINQAPRPLVMAIPGLEPNAAEQILADRDVQRSPERPEQAYETWLLTSGIVDLDQMKKLLPLVTTGGDVYRVQLAGFYDAEGPAVRLEVVLDATQTPAVVKRRRELQQQGPGYSLDVLGAPLDDTP
jgi:DNA uptake protein ComE-like DNA-binding protein